jgi:hypothetical protein
MGNVHAVNNPNTLLFRIRIQQSSVLKTEVCMPTFDKFKLVLTL